mmetsp:Transcript_59159/g.127439  ORF Transcript_59159/g.127439 Transcript_59159/m.127439 type:complete len:255 (+) Transcript_59159:65-829(+)
MRCIATALVIPVLCWEMCEDEHEVSLVQLRGGQHGVCGDVNDGVWKAVCGDWKRVIEEGVVEKSTQVCCSALPGACRGAGDCSSRSDCVSPSCGDLDEYLEVFEGRVVEAFGSVREARECLFSTASRCVGGAGDESPGHVGLMDRRGRGGETATLNRSTGEKDLPTESSIDAYDKALEPMVLSDVGGPRKSSASLVDRASSSSGEVVSANGMDMTLSEKDDVTTSANNIATSGVVGNEEFVNLIDQGPSARSVS